ncbi:hypothetical protein P8452_69685 [Trifolium repens]|nr:hypothetical protein P8452_69685 [Trifolium repens]
MIMQFLIEQIWLNNEAETITRGTVIGGFTIGGTELSLFQITFGTSSSAWMDPRQTIDERKPQAYKFSYTFLQSPDLILFQVWELRKQRKISSKPEFKSGIGNERKWFVTTFRG